MRTSVENLTLYTGCNGQRRCTCKCKFCTQKSQKFSSIVPPYQGKIEEVKRIIELLPNLKNVYILGNPDISVDTSFCNLAAKEFIKAGCKVMFSTSGIGGRNAMEKLLDGLPDDTVDYVSFSVDSLNPETVRFLKGVDIPLSRIEAGIQECIARKIPVKIQPTLWKINQNEIIPIISYFKKFYDINWFTFHFGSLESYSGNDNLHVSADSIRRIYSEVKTLEHIHNLNVKIPMNMLTAEEYSVYKKTYCTHCTDNNPADIQIWMTQNGLMGAYCPVLATIDSRTVFDLEKEDKVAPCGTTCLTCPIQSKTLGQGFDTGEYFPVCLYYKP